VTAGRLYLVRHARTAGNGVRYVGWADEPLDQVGREQARALADRMADVPVDVVYSSPLRRALDTARPLAERHRAPLLIRDALKELHYGEHQGTPKTEKLRLKRFHRVRRLSGGESLRDVFDRVEGVRGELERELRAGRHVAVVAHFWSLRMLVGRFSGLALDEVLDRDDYTPANASVWRAYRTRFGYLPVRLPRRVIPVDG
jgi:probable phosphoglycerate mutase